MNNTNRLIIALIAVLIICWFGYFYTEEMNHIPFKRKNFLQQTLRLIWIVSIGAITYWGFLKHQLKWLSKIIFITYSFVIITILVFGLVDYKFNILNENIKEFFAGVRLFFSSPLPFIFIWFLSKLNLKQS